MYICSVYLYVHMYSLQPRACSPGLEWVVCVCVSTYMNICIVCVMCVSTHMYVCILCNRALARQGLNGILVCLCLLICIYELCVYVCVCMCVSTYIYIYVFSATVRLLAWA